MIKREGHAVLGPIGEFPMPRWLCPLPPRTRMRYNLDGMKTHRRDNKAHTKRKRKA